MKAPSLLVVPVARATRAVEHVEGAGHDATMPAQNHHSSPASTAPTMAMPKPMSVSTLGVRPEPRKTGREG